MSDCEAEGKEPSEGYSGISDAEGDDDDDDDDDGGPSTSWGLKRRNKRPIISDSDDDADEEVITKDDGESCDSDSSSDSTGAMTCAICLGRMRGEVASPNSCEHTFCKFCILEWATNNPTCPQDRLPFSAVLVRKALGGPIDEEVPVSSKPTVDVYEFHEPENLTYCEVCHLSDREDRLLLCDGCDLGYHLECLDPPLSQVPVEEWFCPDCATVQVPDAVSGRAGRPSTSSVRNKRRPSRRRGARNEQQEIRIPRTRATENIRERIKKIRRLKRREKKAEKKRKVMSGEIEDKRAPISKFVEFKSFVQEDDDVDAAHANDRYAEQLLTRGGASSDSTRHPSQRKAEAAKRLREVAFIPQSSYAGRAKNRVIEIVNTQSGDAANDLLSGILENQAIAFTSSKKLVFTNDRKLTAQPDAGLSCDMFQEENSLMSEPLPSQRKELEKSNTDASDVGENLKQEEKEQEEKDSDEKGHHSRSDENGHHSRSNEKGHHSKFDEKGHHSKSDEWKRSPTRYTNSSTSHRNDHRKDHSRDSHRMDKSDNRRDSYHNRDHHHSRYSSHNRHSSSWKSNHPHGHEERYAGYSRSRDHKSYSSRYERHRSRSRDRSPISDRSKERNSKREDGESPLSCHKRSRDHKSSYSSHSYKYNSKGKGKFSGRDSGRSRSQWSFGYSNANDNVISSNNRRSVLSTDTKNQTEAKDGHDESHSSSSAMVPEEYSPAEVSKDQFNEDGSLSGSEPHQKNDKRHRGATDMSSPNNILVMKKVSEGIEDQSSIIKDHKVLEKGHNQDSNHKWNDTETSDESTLQQEAVSLNACIPSGVTVDSISENCDLLKIEKVNICNDNVESIEGQTLKTTPQKKTKIVNLFGDSDNESEAKEQKDTKLIKGTKKCKSKMLFGYDSDDSTVKNPETPDEIATSCISKQKNKNDVDNHAIRKSITKHYGLDDSREDEYEPHSLSKDYGKVDSRHSSTKVDSSHSSTKVDSRHSSTKVDSRHSSTKVDSRHSSTKVEKLFGKGDSERKCPEKYEVKVKDFSEKYDVKVKDFSEKYDVKVKDFSEKLKLPEKYKSSDDKRKAQGHSTSEWNVMEEENDIGDTRDNEKKDIGDTRDNEKKDIGDTRDNEKKDIGETRDNEKKDIGDTRDNEKKDTKAQVKEKHSHKERDKSHGSHEMKDKMLKDNEKFDSSRKLDPACGKSNQVHSADSVDQSKSQGHNISKGKRPKSQERLFHTEKEINVEDKKDQGNKTGLIHSEKHKKTEKSYSHSSHESKQKNKSKKKDFNSLFGDIDDIGSSSMSDSFEAYASKAKDIDHKKNGKKVMDHIDVSEEHKETKCSDHKKNGKKVMDHIDVSEEHKETKCSDHKKNGKKVMDHIDVSEEHKETKCSNISSVTLDTDGSSGNNIGLWSSEEPPLKFRPFTGIKQDDERIKQQKAQLELKVVQEVKKLLNPYYRNKSITKDEYKEIVAKCVKKVVKAECGDVIEPVKMQTLVLGYIKVYKHRQMKNT